MSGVQVELDTGQHVQWTLIHAEPAAGDHVEIAEEGPLLVAMQPQFDIPAVEMGEIVVVTEGTEVVETAEDVAPHMVTVAAVEEVIEAEPYGTEEVVEVETVEESSQAARLSVYSGGYAKAALPKGAKTSNAVVHVRPKGLGKGRLASAKAPPPSSSSESESENDSSQEQSDDGDESKRTPKKREFAHR